MSFKLTDFITVTNTGITTFESDGVFIDRTGADAYLFFRNSGTNRGSIYGGDQSGNAGLRFYIADNSDPSIVLTSVGNVGIGTTSPTNLNSQTSLTIQGASVSRLDLLGASGAGGGVVFGTATAFTVQANYAIPLVLDAGTTADMNFNIGGSTKLTILSGGDVGIGISPSRKLDVQIGSGSSNGVGFINGGGKGLEIYTDSNASNADVYINQTSSDLASLFYQLNGSTKLTISSTGLTQINSTNTTALELITNQSASSLRLKNTGSIVADWIMQSGGITAGDLAFYNLDTSAYRLTISSTGAASFTSSSGIPVYIKQNSVDHYGIVVEAKDNDKWLRMGHNGTTGRIETQRNLGSTAQSDLELATGGTPRLTISSTGTAAFSSPNTTANVAMVTIRSTDSQGADVGGTIGLGGSYGAGLVNYALIRGAKETSTNNDSNGYMSFTVHSSAGQVERMRIASDGAAQFKSVKGSGESLNVKILDSNTNYAQGTGGGLLFQGIFQNNGNIAGGGAIQISKVNSTNGDYSYDMDFYTRPLGSAITKRMTIKSEGNVILEASTAVSGGVQGGNLGLGTTDPQQINGGNRRAYDTCAQVYSNNHDASIIASGGTGGALFLNDRGATADSRQWRITSDGGVFSINALLDNFNRKHNTLEISEGGNVAINSTPFTSGQLYVHGYDSSTTYNLILDNSGGVGTFFVRNNGEISTGNAASSPVNAVTSGSGNCFIASNGIMLTVSSSKKFKNTITDATHGLSDVLKLRSVTYKSNNTKIDGDRLFGGFIAEEVEDLGLKEFVHYDDDDKPKSLHYPNMVSLLTKAIQEQQAQIEELKSEIQLLKNN